MHPAHRVIALLSTLCLADAAVAQVTATRAFAGVHSEGFSAFALATCVPGRIFQGHADLCASVANGIQVVPVATTTCSLPARKSPFLAWTQFGHAIVTFDTPAQRFGGFFGVLGPVPGGTARFYDSADGLLATLPITAPRCSWAWNGWDAGIGAKIKRIDLAAEDASVHGAWLAMDDLEYDPYAGVRLFGTACPGAAGLPALGVGGTLGLGNALAFMVRNTTAPIQVLFLGTSNTTWNGVKLPLSLAFIGARGCDLLVAPELYFASSTGAPMSVQVPVQRSFLGAVTFWQCGLLRDPSRQPIVTTNAAAVLFW